LLLIAMGSVARAQFNMAAPPAIGAAPQASPTPAIHDIRPPLDVFPYPMWMVLTAAGIALLVLVLVIVLIVRYIRSRPKAPPPTPRDIALKRLKEAEADLTRKAPYAFSIQVSDILRQYVSAQYHLHATEQTSPEFLEDASRSPHFTGADKQLLADFLEHCDLIKFARVEATAEDSKALLDQAVRFVQGALGTPISEEEEGNSGGRRTGESRLASATQSPP
jgi:hypothetical protein